MKRTKRWTGWFVLLFLCFWTASSFGAEKVTVRALGSFTHQIQSTIEIPFYKRLQQEAGDRLDIQFRTMDELGQKGFQALRQLRGGVFDIIQIQLGYISGDDPYWQALDLMGVAPDLKTAKKLVEVYCPTLEKRLQGMFNGKLLALWPYGTQVFYFRDKGGRVSGSETLGPVRLGFQPVDQEEAGLRPGHLPVHPREPGPAVDGAAGGG